MRLYGEAKAKRDRAALLKPKPMPKRTQVRQRQTIGTKTATPQDVRDYAKANKMSVDDAKKAFVSSGYTVQ